MGSQSQPFAGKFSPFFCPPVTFSLCLASFTLQYLSVDRRRLPIVLVRLKFVETVKEAVTFVEQGRMKQFFLLNAIEPPPLTSPCVCEDIRVGPDVIKDPAYLVTRSANS